MVLLDILKLFQNAQPGEDPLDLMAVKFFFMVIVAAIGLWLVW